MPKIGKTLANFSRQIRFIKEEFKMIIKILGTGCTKCDKLEINAKQAVTELGIDATIEKVKNLKDIMKYGVMTTPALVVDEKVKVVGKVPSSEEIKKFLK